MKENQLQTITSLFKNNEIRSVWNNEKNPQGLGENIKIADLGGSVSKVARDDIEK